MRNTANGEGVVLFPRFDYEFVRSGYQFQVSNHIMLNITKIYKVKKKGCERGKGGRGYIDYISYRLTYDVWMIVAHSERSISSDSIR
jgi:hypothetical protein